jgi:ABC-type amino acid transport substrate-binding protein
MTKPEGILAFLLTAAMMTAVCPATAKAEDQNSRQTVKVAVLNHSTYADQDENGVWSGMDIETMIDISQKAGFNVEFIDSSADPDFLGNLDNGTYDIVADVKITPEREKQYLFTDESMGTNNSSLIVRADDNRWEYGEHRPDLRHEDRRAGDLCQQRGFPRMVCEASISPRITEYKTFADMTRSPAERQDRRRSVQRHRRRRLYKAVPHHPEISSGDLRLCVPQR